MRNEYLVKKIHDIGLISGFNIKEVKKSIKEI